MTAQALCLKKKVFKEKKDEWALIPHCVRGRVSQQGTYEAAFFFLRFSWMLFLKHTDLLDLIWCAVVLWSPGAYRKEPTKRGEAGSVCTRSLLILAAFKYLFSYLKGTCVSRQCTDTLSTFLTQGSQRAIQSWDEGLSQQGPDADWCLSWAQIRRWRCWIKVCCCLSLYNEFSWGNHLGFFTFVIVSLQSALVLVYITVIYNQLRPPFICSEMLQRTNLAFWMPLLQTSYCNKWGESDAPSQNSYWYLFYQSQSSFSQRDGNA